MRKDIILAVIFTVLSFFFHTYAFGVGDQIIHIPLIQKHLDNTLFPGDLLFSAGQGNLSLFYPILASIVQVSKLPLEMIFFLAYVVTTLLFYMCILHLGKKIFGNHTASYFLFAFLFLLPIPLAGSALYSVEVSFVPRWVAFVISLGNLYWFLSKRWINVSLSAPFIFAFHPLTFGHYVLVLLTFIGLSKKRIPLWSLVVFFISFIVLNAKILLGYHGFSTENAQWLEVLRQRNSYAFADLWPTRAWLGLMLILLPVVIFFRKKSRTIEYRLVMATAGASITATVLQYLFTVTVPSTFVASLQLSRIWVYGYVGAAIALISLLRNKITIFGSILIISIFLLSYLPFSSWFPALRLWQRGYLRQEDSWIDVQRWARAHTTPSCTFLTPLIPGGFRVYSNRPVITEYKDGSLSFYSSSFAALWKKRIEDFNGWEKFSMDKLESLQQVDHFSFLVIPKPLERFGTPVYENDAFAIVPMLKREPDCSVSEVSYPAS